MRSFLINTCKYLENWAREQGLNPAVFIAVYFISLLLLPFAIAWLYHGVKEGASATDNIMRFTVSWVLLQAPSLYIFIMGRKLSRVFMVFLVTMILIVSFWRLGLTGLVIASVVLFTITIVKRNTLS